MGSVATRERVLEAAVELLGTQGLRALTHARVDAAAGVPKGSASNYFRTRAALLAGVVERIVELEMQAGVPGGGPPVLSSAEELVDMLTRMIEAQTSAGRVVTTARYVLFLEGTHDDDVRRPLLEGRARFRALAEQYLALFGAADPVAAATGVMAVGEGLILHRIAVDPVAEVRPAIEAVVRAFVGG